MEKNKSDRGMPVCDDKICAEASARHSPEKKHSFKGVKVETYAWETEYLKPHAPEIRYINLGQNNKIVANGGLLFNNRGSLKQHDQSFSNDTMITGHRALEHIISSTKWFFTLQEIDEVLVALAEG